MRRLRRLLIVALVVVAVVGGLALYLRVQPPAQEAAPVEVERSARVERGDVIVTVNVTGPLTPHKQRTLSFRQVGQVASVAVAQGDWVKAGDVLASLDTTEALLAVADAELALRVAEIALEGAREGPGEADIAAAEAAVEQARANLALASEGPSAEGIAVAQQNLEIQRNALWQQQIQRDGLEGTERDLADFGVHNAELNVAIAEQQLALSQRGADSGSVAVASAGVTQAQAALNRLLAGPSDLDIQALTLQIEIAQLNLELARDALAQMQITAPFDGLVADVNIREGEAITAGSFRPAIVLIDPNRYTIEADIDEVDIAMVKAGQPATVTLDATPDAVLTGRLGWISPTPKDTTALDALAAATGGSVGLVSYPARIEVIPTGTPIRAGMSATVSIEVEALRDTVRIPNWAVAIDRRTGEASVLVRDARGEIEARPVSLGLRNDLYSQVLDGVEVGEEVVVLPRDAFAEFFES